MLPRWFLGLVSGDGLEIAVGEFQCGLVGFVRYQRGFPQESDWPDIDERFLEGAGI